MTVPKYEDMMNPTLHKGGNGMLFHHLKKRHAFHSLIMLFILILYPTVLFADADRIFRENNKAVVVIMTYDSQGNAVAQGSGFIVRADGAIVTNYHVISNAENIKIKVGNKVLKVEGLLYINKENDLVILKADGRGLPTVKIGDMAKVNIGEKVYVIGSPHGLENTISDGILSGIREITSQRKVLQITAPISAGSSGGPVFNQYGEVIGISTFIIKEAQNLNFAMPINLIRDNIDRGKVIAFKDAEIEDYKKTEEYWFYLGFAYADSGKYKEAMEAFKQAIRIKPNVAVSHYNLGIVYDSLGKYQEAIEEYKQAIRIKPDYAEAYDNLGNAYADSGKYKEAIEAFKHAIRIKPDYALAHYNLSVVYDSLGKYQEAIEEYKQVIRINPDIVNAHNNLGTAYVNLGMYREAMEAFKQAIRIKPDDAYAQFNLGVLYLYHVKDRGLALEQYKILKNLDTETANKLFNLIYK